MGCSSSVQVKQNGDIKEKSPLKTKNHTEENELSQTPNFVKREDLIVPKVKFHDPTNNIIMEVKEQEERIQGDGSSSSHQLQEETNGVLHEEKNRKEEDTESYKEDADSFDASLKPISHKKHATQETLNFVYRHGMSSTPSHLTGNFPGSNSGSYGNANSGRYDNNRRRPSGVPPPARELKPGDFLYQKTLNANKVMNTAEEDEEEES